MKRIAVFLALFHVFLLSSSWAQPLTVTGTITSAEDGVPLHGVEISVKGTTVRTFSGSEGNYGIVLPAEDSVLIFSHQYAATEERRVNKSGEINVSLKIDASGPDACYTPYSCTEREKKSAGFAVQKLDEDLLGGTSCVDILSAMSGKISGASLVSSSGAAGASTYLLLRGAGSLGGDNQPLFVIDGVPVDNSQLFSGDPVLGTANLLGGVAYSNRLLDLDPYDISSVTVLRPGAATALYGLQAANGVVMISTRQGREAAGARANYKVSFTSSVSVDKVNQLPALQKKYGQGWNGDRQGPESNIQYSWGPLLDTCSYTNDDLWSHQDMDGDGIYDWDVNGLIVGQNDPYANGSKVNVYENPENFFRTAYSYNNSLNISAINDKSACYLALSDHSGNGVAPGNTFRRTYIKTSGDAAVSKRLRLGGQIHYIYSSGARIRQGDNASGIMSGLLLAPVTFDNANGYLDPASTPSAYMFTSGPAKELQRTFMGYGGIDNPYWSVNRNGFNDRVNRGLGNILLEYLPAGWLSISYRLGADIYHDSRESFLAVNSSAYPEGSVFEDRFFSSLINGDLLIRIQKEINPDFDFDLLAGHNIYQRSLDQLYVQGDKLVQQGFYNLSNAVEISSHEYVIKKRMSALLAHLGLSYRDMVFLEVSGRNEWSTALSKSYFLPSAGLAFVFSEIGKLKSSKALPFGKIRAAWSVTGNDAFVYGQHNVFTPGLFGDSWTTGIVFPYQGINGFTVDDYLRNFNIRPEKNRTIEAGAELRFLKNRLGINFTYYNNRHQDLLIWAPIAGSSGYTHQLLNSAKMENKGIEIVLNAVPVKARNDKFQWDFALNFTKNENKVLQLAGDLDHIALGGFENAEICAVVGRPFGAIYGTQWLRDEAGNMIINDNPADSNYGRPLMSPEKGYLGSTQPDWTMGIWNSFRLYGVSVSFLIDIKQGGKLWNGTRGIMYALGTHADTENRGESVVFDGVMGHLDENGNLVSSGEANTIETVKDQSWYSGLGGGVDGPAEQFVEDAGWVRLREANISYSFNPKWFGKSFIRGVGIFVSGRNLFLWTPYSGIDPETSLTGASNPQGIDYFNLPGIRTYTFGLKVDL